MIPFSLPHKPDSFTVSSLPSILLPIQDDPSRTCSLVMHGITHSVVFDLDTEESAHEWKGEMDAALFSGCSVPSMAIVSGVRH